ncbi:MAG: SoxR reducing system RseC family protein [Woeseiaceae bacterium]|nr:SoxR reducing system RseC family protein [Woeseiaceae bacterium]
MHGTVISISSAGVTLDVDATLACARCASGKGCGAAYFAKDGNRQIRAQLLPGLRVREGQQVKVELAGSNLLRAAMLVYGVPLTGAVAGASLAWALQAGDLVAAALAIAGIGAGLMVSRLMLRREHCLQQFTPIVTGPAAAADPQ